MQPAPYRTQAPPRDEPTVICTLEIDDDVYRCTRLYSPPGRNYRLRKLDGKQREGATYMCHERADRSQACTCPDYTYRRRACKHLLSLRQLGMLAEPPAPAKQAMEPCGYCSGTGKVPTPTHDRLGYPNEGPPEQSCEYCAGTGSCHEGHKLLPARPRPAS